MSFWTTPSGAGFRTLDFLVRRLPPVRRLRMELQASVDYHDYYVTSIDKALGQPRENGDIRSAHMIAIARLRELDRAMTQSMGKSCDNCADKAALRHSTACQICKRNWNHGDHWKSMSANAPVVGRERSERTHQQEVRT